MLAIRFTASSEKLSTPTAGSSINNASVVLEKWLLTFVMSVMDSNVCEGMFLSGRSILVTTEQYEYVTQ